MSTIVQEIEELKIKQDAVILAHSYQPDEVQEVADYVGDSFGLSQQASTCPQKTIVFCGVHFMAESAYILAPNKTILLPERTAGCPLADMIDENSLMEAKEKYPDATVVCYVNTSARVKALSDYCCTSSNALKVVESINNDRILFVPDKNLANYIAKKTNKEIIPWEGFCSTHHKVALEDVKRVRERHPNALIAVHPECKPEVVEAADFVGSTTQIMKYTQDCSAKTVIIGTEMGVVSQLKANCPDKNIYLLSPRLICPNMKKTNLNSVLLALKTMKPKVAVPEDIRQKALIPLQRMLEIK